jgi:hypothetical protein
VLTSGGDNELTTFAQATADGSYEWYKSHAIRARLLYRASEVGIIAVSVSIPAAAAIWPDHVVVAAVLGAFVAAATGLRSVFHWHENYLRFSEAREAVDQERRLYRLRTDHYSDDATRNENLVKAVSAIEQRELGSWLKIASIQPRQ